MSDGGELDFRTRRKTGCRRAHRLARVIVVDVGGEEFDVAPVGGVAEIGDQSRQYIGVGWGGECAGGDD